MEREEKIREYLKKSKSTAAIGRILFYVLNVAKNKEVIEKSKSAFFLNKNQNFFEIFAAFSMIFYVIWSMKV